MDNSHKFFANTACKYYPCHAGIEHINCMFCYCPMYHLDCPGEYIILDRKDGISGNRIKDCSNCHIPHSEHGWEIVVEFLGGEPID